MPKMKPPDLTNVKEADLLQAVVDITLREGPLSEHDREELELITQEFQRRDALALAP